MPRPTSVKCLTCWMPPRRVPTPAARNANHFPVPYGIAAIRFPPARRIPMQLFKWHWAKPPVLLVGAFGGGGSGGGRGVAFRSQGGVEGFEQQEDVLLRR